MCSKKTCQKSAHLLCNLVEWWWMFWIIRLSTYCESSTIKILPVTSTDMDRYVLYVLHPQLKCDCIAHKKLLNFTSLSVKKKHVYGSGMYVPFLMKSKRVFALLGIDEEKRRWRRKKFPSTFHLHRMGKWRRDLLLLFDCLVGRLFSSNKVIIITKTSDE